MSQIWCKHEKICGQIGFDWDCRDNCNKFEPDITHDHLRALAKLIAHSYDVCDFCPVSGGSEFRCCDCEKTMIDYALNNPKKEV